MLGNTAIADSPLTGFFAGGNQDVIEQVCGRYVRVSFISSVKDVVSVRSKVVANSVTFDGGPDITANQIQYDGSYISDNTKALSFKP